MSQFESFFRRSLGKSLLPVDGSRTGIALPNRADIRRTAAWGLVAVACMCSNVGCSAFGNRKLVEQLQAENEKLLSEFRGQRERAAELAQANRLLEDRIAETEKLLARQFQSGGMSTARANPTPQSSPTLPSSLEPSSLGGAAGGAPVYRFDGKELASDPSYGGSSDGTLKWQPR